MLDSIVDYVKQKSRAAYESFSGTCSQTYQIGKTILSSDPVTRYIQFHGEQFTEGLQGVGTFPFRLLKMPFRQQTATFGYHVLKYNVVYYLAPTIGYYCFLRQALKDAFEEDNAIPIELLDVIISMAFARAALNNYITSVFINANASSLKIAEKEHEKRHACDCPEGKRIEASLLSPLDNLLKKAGPIAAYHIPYIGPLIYYTLEPLAIGEELATLIHLSEACREHRKTYLAQHNSYHLGLGAAILFYVNACSYTLYYITGGYHPFISDALFQSIYPLIIFHYNNTAISPDVKPSDTPFNCFKYIWEASEDLVKTAPDYFPAKTKGGSLLNQLRNVWFSSAMRLIKKMMLYPQFRHAPKELVLFEPLQLLIKNNNKLIQDKLDTIRMVRDNPQLIQYALAFYSLLPLVPPKEHTRFVVKILAGNLEYTEYYLRFAKQLIEFANNPSPGIIEPTFDTSLSSKPKQLEESFDLEDIPIPQHKEQEEKFAHDQKQRENDIAVFTANALFTHKRQLSFNDLPTHSKKPPSPNYIESDWHTIDKVEEDPFEDKAEGLLLQFEQLKVRSNAFNAFDQRANNKEPKKPINTVTTNELKAFQTNYETVHAQKIRDIEDQQAMNNIIKDFYKISVEDPPSTNVAQEQRHTLERAKWHRRSRSAL